MFSDPLDMALDIIAGISMVIAIYYILKLYRHGKNPVMMLMSPLVLYKYLVFLVSLVLVFFAVDTIADDILMNADLLVYGFEFGLASGSFGIMLIVRRVYEQVAHPEKAHVRRKLKTEMDEIMRRRMRFREDKFREDNR